MGLSSTEQPYCGEAGEESYTDKPTHAGNIINGGKVAQSGGWVYFADASAECLYKVRTDGSDRMRIADDLASYINVAGGWVYYVNESDNMCIYKVRTDGTERIRLNDVPSNNLIVSGDEVYYLRLAQAYDDYISDNYGIYKMNTDGSEVVRVAGEFATNLHIIGEWLYYTAYEGEDTAFSEELQDVNMLFDNYVYKMHIDSGERVLILEESVLKMVIDNDYIYYTLYAKLWMSSSLAQGLFRVNIDGTDKTEIQEWVMVFNVFDGTVFSSGGDGLYKMNADGTGAELLSDASDLGADYFNRNYILGIFVFDDWVYFSEMFFDNDEALGSFYEDYSDEFYAMFKDRLFRIRHDGSGLQRVDGFDAGAVTTDAPKADEVDGSRELTPIFEDFVPFDPETMGFNDGFSKLERIEKDGWVYYEARGERTHCLFRERADGTDKTQLTSEPSSAFTIVGEWVYYCNGLPTGGSLNKMRLDGTENTKIFSAGKGVIFVKDVTREWIYFERSVTDSLRDPGTRHRVRHDGTGFEEVEFES